MSTPQETDEQREIECPKCGEEIIVTFRWVTTGRHFGIDVLDYIGPEYELQIVSDDRSADCVAGCQLSNDALKDAVLDCFLSEAETAYERSLER